MRQRRYSLDLQLWLMLRSISRDNSNRPPFDANVNLGSRIHAYSRPGILWSESLMAWLVVCLELRKRLLHKLHTNVRYCIYGIYLIATTAQCWLHPHRSTYLYALPIGSETIFLCFSFSWVWIPNCMDQVNRQPSTVQRISSNPLLLASWNRKKP